MRVRVGLVSALVLGASLHAGAFAPAAKATHVTCGDTITTDTVLDSDVVCPGGGPDVGLSVTAGVTLDLNGHEVQGLGNDVGILIHGARGARVLNGTVRGFDVGIKIQSATGSLLGDPRQEANEPRTVLRVTGNGVGILAEAAPKTEIWQVLVSDNDREGMLLTDADSSIVHLNRVRSNAGNGITVAKSRSVTLVLNEIENNEGLGVLFEEVSRASVFDNSARRNGTAGFSVFRGEGNNFFRNTAEGHLFGFFVGGNLTKAECPISRSDRPRPHVLRHNTAADNESIGFFVVNSWGDILHRNRATNNGNGIHVGASTDTVVRGNDVSASQFAGILVSGGAPCHPQTGPVTTLVSDNRVHDNEDGIVVENGDLEYVKVQANVAEANKRDGIRTNRFGVAIYSNGAYRNGDDGIDANERATVWANEANDNGDYGIEAVPVVTDAGGNRASGNGNPAQCLNVTCR